MRKFFIFFSTAIILTATVLGGKKWTLPYISSTPKIALESLSDSERAALESFFRTLLMDTQCGYVLYGDKPICIEGILPKDDNLLMIGGELHRRSIILKEGCKFARI